MNAHPMPRRNHACTHGTKDIPHRPRGSVALHLRPLEGHLVSGYRDGGDAPGKQLELVPGAIEDANEFLEGYSETGQRLERVSYVVCGFESSFGLELLATVHWVAAEHPSSTEDEVIAHTYAWNPRKRQFSERQIRLALQVLEERGWLGT